MAPRCKLCAAPFSGPGRLLTRVLQHGNSVSNPLLCSLCFGKLRDGPGGAEVELTVLFADIRGSTGLAERSSPGAFTKLVQRFYVGAARAIDDNGGIVDKFLGDGVMALFIPLISGEAHAQRGIAAAMAVLRASATDELLDAGARVGVGLHTGEAFVGTVGTGDRLDFSALGDTVNVAARLGSVAGPGELVASAAAWDIGGSKERGAERRTIEVSGRTAPLDVVVVRARPTEAPLEV
jgi:adenylate cyclase